LKAKVSFVQKKFIASVDEFNQGTKFMYKLVFREGYLEV